ncbi:hypothetical protein AB0I66_00140 [Streptomyces sp. NPDC050439]|uniref:hypothetical protein n=1 Tax=unclassified Streptomyces TaxID=2593676 RepID=UPI003431E783
MTSQWPRETVVGAAQGPAQRSIGDKDGVRRTMVEIDAEDVAVSRTAAPESGAR